MPDTTAQQLVKAQETIIIAQQARELLDNPVLVKFFDEAESELIHVWESSNSTDVVSREQTWMLLKMLKKLKSTLNVYVKRESMANAILDGKPISPSTIF